MATSLSIKETISFHGEIVIPHTKRNLDLAFMAALSKLLN